MKKLLGCAFTVVFLLSCAGGQVREKVDPARLYSRTCSIGRQTLQVTGQAWLKAKSKEASGQFPAFVEAKAPADLRMEITNLLGGTEAVITIHDQHYQIEVPQKKNPQVESGYGTWAGIPLRWATELFLGRIPCPGNSNGIRVSKVSEEDLLVETPKTIEGDAETYAYHYREWGGQLWPETLRWERRGAFQTVVEFKFEAPDDRTESPTRWQAKSEQGEVLVRWRKRDVSP